ncbi:MAG TPA: hemolysin family protein [Terriglobales bacterium]|nr:hemolysin family protein [Terriglobales bacterium]
MTTVPAEQAVARLAAGFGLLLQGSKLGLEGEPGLALLRVIGIMVLVAANAFFVAAEFSLVSIRETRLQQLMATRRAAASSITRLQEHLEQFLSGVQFGVTMTSLGLGWVGEQTLARMLQPSFARLPHGVVFAHALAAAISFALITFFHVTLGEVVPKAIALQRAERVALAVARPMEIFIAVSRPALWVFSRASLFVLRLLGTRPVLEAGVHSPEELKLMATASRRLGLVQPLEEEMIHSALELGDVAVREIMVPRPDIFSLPADMPLEEAAAHVVEEQHSRVPLYDPARGPEHIIGVLYAKELMRWLHLRRGDYGVFAPAASTMRARSIMRDVLVVPESKNISDLLAEFKQRRRQLAVVVDEFGSTAGVVTVEDVLEQLVGEIEDEFDVAPATPRRAGGDIVLEGSTNLRDLEAQYNITLPRDRGFETLAGFMLSELQHLPKAGESVEHNGRRFSVAEVQGLRVAQVKIEELRAGAAQRS